MVLLFPAPYDGNEPEKPARGQGSTPEPITEPLACVKLPVLRPAGENGPQLAGALAEAMARIDELLKDHYIVVLLPEGASMPIIDGSLHGDSAAVCGQGADVPIHCEHEGTRCDSSEGDGYDARTR
jgi:hypothetical protein